MKEIRINYEEELSDIIIEDINFPKYTTQIINLANQNAGGTRPNVVGQMSDLIQECPNKSLEGWEKWYLEKYPNTISAATDKIMPMISNFKDAIELIDREMVEAWVRDLTITKTAEGFIIQEIILKCIASELGKDWRVGTKEEESKNIDGYIGDIPVQIKPETYKSQKPIVKEEIPISIIYYKKTKGSKYLTIYTDLI